MELEKLVYILRIIIVGLGESYYMICFQIVHCGWKNMRWRMPAVFLNMLAIAALVSGPLCGEDIYPAGPLIIIAVIILFSHFYLEGNIGKHIFVIALSLLLLAFNDVLCGLAFAGIFHIKMPDMQPGGRLNDICSIITKLILVAWSLPYFIWIRGKKYKDSIRIGGGYALLAAMIAVLVLAVVGKGITSFPMLEFFLFMFVILCIFFIFYFIIIRSFWNMQKLNEQRIRYELECQRQELDEKQEQEIQKLYNSLRELRHDMKNHMSFMARLAEREDYEKLEKYLKEMRKSVYSDSSS